MSTPNVEVKVVPSEAPAKISIISDPNVPSVIKVIPSPGPKGSSGGNYTHNQSAVSNVWIVNHNLGYNPNVSILDSAESNVEAEIWYNNTNSLEIRFSVGISGKAYLS